MSQGGGYGHGKGRRGLGKRTSASRLHTVDPLPVISEGPPDSTPEIPEKAYGRRSAAARDPQFPYPGSPPPAYCSHTPSTSDPSTRSYDVGPQEPLPVDKRPPWMVSRGGWWKILLGLLFGVLCVVALAVGLAIGLRKNNSGSSGNDGGSSAPVFPAGSYAFNTALANVSTACTKEASTFRCYPYTTYAQSSSSSSRAVFHWTITPNEGNAYSLFRISAAKNPFVPQFDNVDMQLLSQGQDDERLVFRFTMDAAVVPSPQLPANVSGNSAVTCHYNSTVMGATIYTRRRASYPTGLGTPVNNTSTGGSASFDAWPYAVDVRQVATAGAGVPDCRDVQGRPVGNFAVIEQTGSNTPSAPPSSCSCLYQNYDL
ncbi:hypothetical protein Micbo1qcDRAFT_163100 [Microdochium bolleyi]|uniref:Tat pathway signal sequence n=1 Tax=Microdochium bolleyi TaxID=196109 RepID=A0A136J2L5_9PEZI|nr:hypothetical protein Micbo1qcDRAFT_163100 [Microdochium bolleyi]